MLELELLLNKISNDVDPDIRDAMFRKVGDNPAAWEYLQDPCAVMLDWQLVRDTSLASQIASQKLLPSKMITDTQKGGRGLKEPPKAD